MHNNIEIFYDLALINSYKTSIFMNKLPSILKTKTIGGLQFIIRKPLALLRRKKTS